MAGKNSGTKLEINETEENLKEIAAITKLNNDITDILKTGIDVSADDMDLDLHIQKMKQNLPAVVSTFKNELDISEKSPFSEDDIINDYISIRENILAAINILKGVLKNLPFDGAGVIKPIMIANCTQLLKEIREHEKFLLEMHDRIIENKKNKIETAKNNPKPGVQNNTFLFATDTKTMREMSRRAIQESGVEIGTAEEIQ